ncbi:MAG TPA: LysM peptidoglycan-binding domain-containing protein [Leucothrix mucor]|uniref:LysM peptidoglycan-binding domain-containing protein n=1 Tax=Leucothrix mucor TaxID=45248 RepID=A0A7V2WVN2_LEUMU|nr:LysM peptidoglycan-binding domain-containing protein [Leucothrix mucor]
MLLKKSIAIALFATSSLVCISTANATTDENLLSIANKLLNIEEKTQSKSTPDAVDAIMREMKKPKAQLNVTSKEDAELDSAAVLLGIAPLVPSRPIPTPVHISRNVPQFNQSQPLAQSRQQRLLNKRKRENLQRLRNKKLRLNRQQQLLRLARTRNRTYQRVNTATRLPANSVWHRVKNGFRFRNDQYRPIVQRAIQRMRSNRGGVMRTLNRSTDYLHLVATELQRRRMPTDLVLLPMVESAYITKARSHAGAAGMWQFIRGTGKRYGLKQTHGYDGRLDVIESTRAAMDYLQKLHREFRGDWFLALAAYNCGENRVHREIEKNRARGLPTDYWSLSLPRETRNYVPKLLAYREVIRSPRSFGIRLPHAVNAPKLIQVYFSKAVDLKKVAYQAGMQASTMQHLNPGFKYGITMPSMTRKILVPRQYAGNMQRAIQRAPTVSPIKIAKYSRATRTYRRRYKRKSRVHRVRHGESLSRIASRYGTTVRKLKRLNRIRGSRIKAGRRLRVAAKSRRSKRG